MTNFFEVVTKKNRFRAACKDLTVSDMKIMAINLAEFIEKRVKQENENQAAQAAHLAKKQEILKAISAAGLSIDDFFTMDEPKSKKDKKSVIVHYRIKDDHGNTHEWSGRGRPPKAFADFFNKGGSRDSCRI